MKNLIFLSIIVFLSSCIARVTPNEFVVVTADCWNNMEVIEAGQTPPRLMTPCDRKIILPAYLMDGSVEVPARFQGDVKGLIKLDYQYEIKNPIQFVQSAKFVTSSQTDEYGMIDHNTLERAENVAIDKIVKDIVRDYIPNVNPVDIEESRIEDDLVPVINKTLESRGVFMSTVSVDIDFKEQTEQALDVISAYNLYKNAGIEGIGESVIANQAGKPEIKVEVKTQPIED